MCETCICRMNHVLEKHNAAIFLLGIGMMLTGFIGMNQEERIVKLEKKIKRLEEERTVG